MIKSPNISNNIKDLLKSEETPNIKGKRGINKKFTLFWTKSAKGNCSPIQFSGIQTLLLAPRRPYKNNITTKIENIIPPFNQ